MGFERQYNIFGWKMEATGSKRVKPRWGVLCGKGKYTAADKGVQNGIEESQSRLRSADRDQGDSIAADEYQYLQRCSDEPWYGAWPKCQGGQSRLSTTNGDFMVHIPAENCGKGEHGGRECTTNYSSNNPDGWAPMRSRCTHFSGGTSNQQVSSVQCDGLLQCWGPLTGSVVCFSLCSYVQKGWGDENQPTSVLNDESGCFQSKIYFRGSAKLNTIFV